MKTNGSRLCTGSHKLSKTCTQGCMDPSGPTQGNTMSATGRDIGWAITGNKVLQIEVKC